jgi:hypothetical protein
MAGHARRTGWAAALSWALWGAMTTLLAFEFPTLAVLLGLAGFMLARLLRLWPRARVRRRRPMAVSRSWPASAPCSVPRSRIPIRVVG